MTKVRQYRFLSLLVHILLGVCRGIQQFEESPQYTEVNPGQDAKMICRVLGKRGQCIWQKDQKPIGMHLKKYEWVGRPDIGDCSLWVRSATLEFDDGLWQCQVTASDFTTQDALASESARLVVRVSPQRPQIEYADRLILPGSNVTARAADRAETKRTAPREFRGAVCRKSSEMKEIGKRSSRKLKRSSSCRKDPSNNVGFQEEALNAFRLQPLSRRCARVQSSSSNAAPFRN